MKVTIRADDTVEIEGYVNAVGRDSRRLTDEYGYPFVEQIVPGVFGTALSRANAEQREIMMLLDHDANHVIGGTASNLILEEDAIGLHALAEVTDAEVIRAAREKRLRGWSFGFRGLDYKEEWTSDTNRRQITEMELVEVSVIDEKMTPAYAGTSIHARAGKEDDVVYVRAMDDTVSYVEEPKEEKEPEAPAPEVRAERQEAPAEPENCAGATETPDYSTYRNTIELLKLG